MIKYSRLKNAFKVHSHLTYKEKIQLYKLCIDRTRVIEVGSYVGASACCLGAALHRSGKGRIFCIDTWNNDAMSEGGRDTWREFSNNTIKYNKYITPVRGYSTEVVDIIKSQCEDIDLLFIDGDHSYEGVRKDWDAYRSFLKPESIVVLHDWGWAEGVRKVIEEDIKPIVTHYESLPNMWWGTIGSQM